MNDPWISAACVARARDVAPTRWCASHASSSARAGWHPPHSAPAPQRDWRSSIERAPSATAAWTARSFTARQWHTYTTRRLSEPNRQCKMLVTCRERGDACPGSARDLQRAGTERAGSTSVSSMTLPAGSATNAARTVRPKSSRRVRAHHEAAPAASRPPWWSPSRRRAQQREVREPRRRDHLGDHADVHLGVARLEPGAGAEGLRSRDGLEPEDVAVEARAASRSSTITVTWL